MAWDNFERKSSIKGNTTYGPSNTSHNCNWYSEKIRKNNTHQLSSWHQNLVKKEMWSKAHSPINGPGNTARGACWRAKHPRRGGWMPPGWLHHEVQAQHSLAWWWAQRSSQGLTCCTDFQPTAIMRNISIHIVYNRKTSVGKWAIRDNETTPAD